MIIAVPLHASRVHIKASPLELQEADESPNLTESRWAWSTGVDDKASRSPLFRFRMSRRKSRLSGNPEGEEEGRQLQLLTPVHRKFVEVIHLIREA